MTPRRDDKWFIFTQRFLVVFAMACSLIALVEIALHHRSPQAVGVIMLLLPSLLVTGYSHLRGPARKAFSGLLAIAVPALIAIVLS